jgi:hypothetical protein
MLRRQRPDQSCAGKDLIKIDSGRGCLYGRKRLKRDARTDAEGDDNYD